MLDWIQRFVVTPGRVLDRAAGQARVDGSPHRFLDGVGIVAKPVLEVSGHRQRGSRHDRGRVGERLLPRDRVVEPAQRGSESGAGGGQRLEAQRGQQLRRTGVPWVGDQQRITGAMEVQKTLRELVHVASLAHGPAGRQASIIATSTAARVQMPTPSGTSSPKVSSSRERGSARSGSKEVSRVSVLPREGTSESAMGASRLFNGAASTS